MELAHTLGEGGPEIEYLIIALALLVLGVIFFMQKAVKPVVSVVLVIAAFALGAGAFAAGGSSDPGGSGDSGGELSVTITSPKEGELVLADTPQAIEVELEGAELDPEVGHIDVRVDGETETMMDPSPEVTFEPGEHTLTVEFVTPTHDSFNPPVMDEIEVTAVTVMPE